MLIPYIIGRYYVPIGQTVRARNFRIQTYRLYFCRLPTAFVGDMASDSLVHDGPERPLVQVRPREPLLDRMNISKGRYVRQLTVQALVPDGPLQAAMVVRRELLLLGGERGKHDTSHGLIAPPPQHYFAFSFSSFSAVRYNA